MLQRPLCERLSLRQPLQNDCISTFTKQLDLTIWHADDGGHAFSRRVEFADVEYFEFEGLAVYFDEDGFGFAGLGEG